MSFRKDRVGEAIRQEIALMLMKGEVKDPRLESVSITGVEMSPDLSHAKVWFTPLGAQGEEKVKTCLAAFKQAGGFLRSQIGKRLRLRIAPQLRFHYDTSIDRGDRIDQLLAGLNSDRPMEE